MKNKKIVIIVAMLIMCFLGYNEYIDKSLSYKNNELYLKEEIPKYENIDYVILNNNVPNFDDLSRSTNSFEVYSELDYLGRAGVAYANLSKKLMPKEERKSIGMIKPTGWHTIKYENIDGKYLYNRCHLIGFQLAGENANKNNLITCTRHMNVDSMLEYENKVSNYIKKTNNHVLYRVTPVYIENNLLASGVQMEALSIEDEGKGIKFNVFIYNVQPGIEIDYKTGNSKLSIK